MKRLTAAQGRQHFILATDLVEAEEEVADAIAKFNHDAAALHLKLKGTIDRYNAAAVKAQEFVTEIHEQQEEYASERSDIWRNMDAGSEYESWMDAWSVELDTIELEPFVPYDPLMLDDGAAAFHDLPKETS